MNRCLPFVKLFLGWGLHVSVCAGPSFALALAAGYRTQPAVTGMILAVLTFVLFFTIAEACLQKTPFRRLRQAVIWAIRLRTALTLLGSTVFVVPDRFDFVTIILAPDFIIGKTVVNFMASLHGRELKGDEFPSGGMTSFLSTYCTTVIDGALLSTTFLLLIPAVYAVIRFREKPAAAAT